MILHEVRPKTIIEIGAFNGGSAIWLADNLDIFGVEASVNNYNILITE